MSFYYLKKIENGQSGLEMWSCILHLKRFNVSENYIEKIRYNSLKQQIYLLGTGL